MHSFDDLSEVESTLQRLMKREPPLVKILPRQPGTKEARYAHLLSGDVEAIQPEAKAEMPRNNFGDADRIAHLENQVSQLQSEVAELKREFSAFQKQFEP
jgi:uncharacterized protein YceH (UPF0502 family)